MATPGNCLVIGRPERNETEPLRYSVGALITPTAN
jgi:hypothetical protein